MLLTSLALVLLSVGPAQCTTVRRDGASIVAAFTTISNQLVAMNTTLNSFEGGFNGTLLALQIQAEASSLQSDVSAATTTITQSAALSDVESSTVAYAVVSLSSDIYDVLDNLVAKKPAFDSAILGIASASFLVKSDLQNLKNGTDALGAALTQKLTITVAQVAPLLISAIDFHFNQALTVYA